MPISVDIDDLIRYIQEEKDYGATTIKVEGSLVSNADDCIIINTENDSK